MADTVHLTVKFRRFRFYCAKVVLVSVGSFAISGNWADRIGTAVLKWVKNDLVVVVNGERV